MRFEGTTEIVAPRQKVWDFLMDPNQVGSCGPGVQSITVVDDAHFDARAKVGVGFITPTFTIKLEFVELVAPDSAVIRARGQAPGSAVDALATMKLAGDAAGPTTMAWAADVTISGTLASVGSRMIEGTANKMIGQTFTCIQSKLEA